MGFTKTRALASSSHHDSNELEIWLGFQEVTMTQDRHHSAAGPEHCPPTQGPQLILPSSRGGQKANTPQQLSSSSSQGLLLCLWQRGNLLEEGRCAKSGSKKGRKDGSGSSRPEADLRPVEDAGADLKGVDLGASERQLGDPRKSAQSALQDQPGFLL